VGLGNQKIGKLLRFSDPNRLYGLLKAAQTVENSLRERRPGGVTLHRTEEPLSKAKTRLIMPIDRNA
jgi:hypothetical protein